MALTDPLIVGPGIGPNSSRKVYHITTADLVALGAFTTGTLTLENLPAGAVITHSRIKHTQSVAGPSISAATARVAFNGTAMGSGTLDVFAAVGATAGTHYITDITGVGSGLIDAVNALTVSMTCTGANFSVATAGAISIWVNWHILG